MIALLAVTGLLVFMLFFLAATFNAIVISLLMSLAAAGGFLALFFAFVTAIYIGALSVAVVVISTTTISAIIAVIITTGRPSPSAFSSLFCILIICHSIFRLLLLPGFPSLKITWATKSFLLSNLQIQSLKYTVSSSCFTCQSVNFNFSWPMVCHEIWLESRVGYERF